MRKKIVAGNWKMNMDLDEGLNLAKSVNDYFRNKPAEKCEVILCTPFIHLAGVSEILKSGSLKPVLRIVLQRLRAPIPEKYLH